MIDAQGFNKFQVEFFDLLKRHQVGTYLIGVVVHEQDGDLSDLPVLSNIVGLREQGIAPNRICAVFVEHLLHGQLKLLMQYCGLTLHQAVGALQESVKAAAGTIQEEQEAFVRKGQDTVES